MTQRNKFQFSNPAAQRAEALLNAREARELADRHSPRHLRESAPPATSEAGACFRRVCQLLAGKVGK